MNKTIKNLITKIKGNKAYENANVENYEGNKAFTLKDEDLFLQTLLTNTCTDTFYVSKDKLLEESFEIHKEILNKDPEFFAKALIYARNKGFMRLQPILGLVFLSTIEDKSYFRKAFQNIIKTPEDLESFIDFCRSKTIRSGLGRAVKNEINNYLKYNLTEYHAIKYRKEIEYSIKIARPSVKIFDSLKKDIVEYLMKNEISNELNQINSYVELKTLNVEKDENKIVELINKGKLPYEAIVGTLKPTKKIWEALLYQMPIMATLRNINTMARHRVFETKMFSKNNAVEYVVEKLSYSNKSKILPFRFYDALDNLDLEVPQEIKEALIDALEKSFENMPELPGKTCIVPDVSGSMYGKPSKIASIFSAALLKKSEKCAVLPVDTQLHEHTCSRRDSIMSNAQKIMKLGGGGTELDLPIEYLLKNRIKVDNYICLTDSEEWYSDNRWSRYNGRGFYKALLEYKSKVNKDVKVFFIRIQPYNHSTVDKHEKNVFNVEGWSNSVLDYISTIISIDKGIKDEISTIEI